MELFNDPIQVEAISHLIREVAEVGLEVHIHKWNCWGELMTMFGYQ